MATVGGLMIAIGVLLMWESWQSHKTKTAPAPITHATTVLGSLGSTSSTPAPVSVG